MIPKFVAYEYWPEPGNPVLVPARWVPGEAWALHNGTWVRVDSTDVGNEGRELDEETFNKSFANVLIPLPPAAFQRADNAESTPTPAKSMRASLEALGLKVLPPTGKAFVIGGVRSPKLSK